MFKKVWKIVLGTLKFSKLKLLLMIPISLLAKVAASIIPAVLILPTYLLLSSNFVLGVLAIIPASILSYALVLGICSCFNIGIKGYLADKNAKITIVFTPFRHFLRVFCLKLNYWAKTSAHIIIPQLIIAAIFAFTSKLPDLYMFWVIVFGVYGIVTAVIGSLRYYFIDNVFMENPNLCGSTGKEEYMREHLGKKQSNIVKTLLKPWYIFCYYAFEKNGVTSIMNRSDEITAGNKGVIFLINTVLTLIPAFLVGVLALIYALVFLFAPTAAVIVLILGEIIVAIVAFIFEILLHTANAVSYNTFKESAE